MCFRKTRKFYIFHDKQAERKKQVSNTSRYILTLLHNYIHRNEAVISVFWVVSFVQ